MSCDPHPRLRCIALTVLASLALATTTQAQTATDEALARLEAIDTLRLGIVRIPTVTLGVRDDDPIRGGVEASVGFGFGFAIAGLEKRGSAWEAIRLDEFRLTSRHEASVAFTVLDLQQLMFGTDIDHDTCVASLFVITHGDCQHGGVFGIHAQLFHHTYASSNERWFHRWFELGAVISPIGDSFDVDFVRARLPITIGVSLDHAANLSNPPRPGEVRLRGLASIAGVYRSADYRLELTGAVDYRPALVPFDFTDDSAATAQVKVAYVWLAPLFGSIRAPAQRLYLEARASHYDRPWLSERPLASRNTLEITIGFELGLREVTPS